MYFLLSFRARLLTDVLTVLLHLQEVRGHVIFIHNSLLADDLSPDCRWDFGSLSFF